MLFVFLLFKEKKTQQFGAPVRREGSPEIQVNGFEIIQNKPAPTPRNKINWVLKTVIDRCRFGSELPNNFTRCNQIWASLW